MSAGRDHQLNGHPLSAREKARRENALLAVEHLSAADPRLSAIIERFGPYRPNVHPNPFSTLFGAITQQQISMSAADAIRRKIQALCPNRRIHPRAIAALPAGRLRSAGLSRQKVKYVRALADAFVSRELSGTKLRAMSDEEVIVATTALPGIGRWTAEMLLIFCLERPDVWPVDDLGIRKAVQRLLRASEIPARKKIERLADPWRPFRSYASWYLWRSLEGPLMPGTAL
jgi:DNA-3-methyladenine glycosylase II